MQTHVIYSWKCGEDSTRGAILLNIVLFTYDPKRLGSFRRCIRSDDGLGISDAV